ncbi:MAG TPA: CAP domain-containing protein [Mycobacteriales bacterium]|nr:CAP domain-containing protein [Mycobacteriales bacterium]
MTVHRRLAATTAAVAALGLAFAPLAASASTATPARTGVNRHPAAHVRAYDQTMLTDANNARAANQVHRFSMNHKLWKIAHAWAKHLSKTGTLEHNAALVQDVTAACPHWTAVGENVGVTYGENEHHMFEAYMHSPPHRANILDKHYRQVGIATVRVVRHGQTEQWNVMDFGNRC